MRSETRPHILPVYLDCLMLVHRTHGDSPMIRVHKVVINEVKVLLIAKKGAHLVDLPLVLEYVSAILTTLITLLRQLATIVVDKG